MQNNIQRKYRVFARTVIEEVIEADSEDQAIALFGEEYGDFDEIQVTLLPIHKFRITFEINGDEKGFDYLSSDLNLDLESIKPVTDKFCGGLPYNNLDFTFIENIYDY